jgi:meso-butanediol dehydrogenase/(S,S)-butanediol dehydrogenase/diacetyl reductase
MELKGRTVIVTGAARGIGRGIAEAFAREGARVVIGDLGSLAGGASGEWAYRLASKDELEAASEEIRSRGGEALSVEVDVSRDDSCRALIDATRERFGGIDVLVNNAGLVKSGAITSYEESDWDHLFAVNVKGVFLASRAAIPALVEGGGGAIINISSIAGKRGYAGLGVYCASKFAVIGLTQAMSQELAGSGIRVSAICPGLLPTAMWLDHLSGAVAPLVGKEAGQEAFQEYVARNTPLGREQTPADVAEAALYLARADNVTGVSLNIAGGTEMN